MKCIDYNLEICPYCRIFDNECILQLILSQINLYGFERIFGYQSHIYNYNNKYLDYYKCILQKHYPNSLFKFDKILLLK